MALRRAVLVPVCKRHKIKLNEASSLWQAAKIHFQHVYAINRAGVNERVHSATKPKQN
jgi:hypothetical protein